MVARVTLNNMTQDREETVQSFGARLRGQAGVCKFVLKCNNCDTDVNYADAILRDVLTRGLYDSEIQFELLQNQNITLEQVFKFVEAKEAGRRSASKLMDSQGAESASSSYRRNKNADRLKVDKPKVETREVCLYCGKTGHGVRAPPRIRQRECVAYGQTCQKCSQRFSRSD